MSNEYVWQPKDDQENAILAAANHLLRFGHPPVGERLCRRVPAPQGVSVPMAVRAAINWLDSNSQPLAVKETEWTERWGIVLDWLDACPERDGGSQCQQPQQEGSDAQ